MHHLGWQSCLSIRTKCSRESCNWKSVNALFQFTLGEFHLISEFSRLQPPEALWLSLGKLKEAYFIFCKVQRKEVQRGEFETFKHRVISGKREKRDCVLTVLFRTSMLGNFLLMYLRDDSIDFSSKKGGLDLGSEQVCTDKKTSYFFPPPQKTPYFNPFSCPSER